MEIKSRLGWTAAILSIVYSLQIPNLEAKTVEVAVQPSETVQVYTEYQPKTNTKGPYQRLITKASQRYKIDECIIRAIISKESRYNSKAISSAGAVGLGQLMPDTARSLGLTVIIENIPNQEKDDRFNPAKNIFATTRYINMIQTGGDTIKEIATKYLLGPNKDATKLSKRRTLELELYVNEILNNYKSCESQ